MVTGALVIDDTDRKITRWRNELRMAEREYHRKHYETDENYRERRKKDARDRWRKKHWSTERLLAMKDSVLERGKYRKRYKQQIQ